MKKRTRNGIYPVYLLAISLLVSCQTKENEERDRRIFAMQTRMLRLEDRVLTENKAAIKSGEHLSMNLAESQVNQEEARRSLQTLEGDLETLRYFLGINGLSPDELSSKGLDNRLLLIEKRLDEVPRKQEKLEEKIKELRKTQNKILENIENLAKINASKKSSVKNTRKRAKLKSLNEAKKAYKGKRYLHVAEDFLNLERKVKDSEKPELNYLHAQSLFKLGRISAAAVSFDELLKSKKLGAKASKVYLRLGDCFRLLGDKKTALIYYEELVTKFPKSAEVKIARNYLEKLKT